MNDMLEWARVLLPILFTAGGIAGGLSAVFGAIGACMAIRFQQAKLKADARSAEISADSGSVELLKKLMVTVSEQAAKILVLEEQHREAVMREAEMKVDLESQKVKIADLTERLQACEDFRRAAQAVADAAAQALPKKP